jgi:hypothetical protein
MKNNQIPKFQFLTERQKRVGKTKTIFYHSYRPNLDNSIFK